MKATDSASDLGLHGVDGDVEARVVPLQLHAAVLHPHHLSALVGRPDADHSQDDHEQQETHTHHDDGHHTQIWTQHIEMSYICN